MKNERYYRHFFKKTINSTQKAIWNKEETFIILILAFPTKRFVSVMRHPFKATRHSVVLYFEDVSQRR